MAGQNLARLVCGKSNYSISPFPHDGSNFAALYKALYGKNNNFGLKGQVMISGKLRNILAREVKRRRGGNEPTGYW